MIPEKNVFKAGKAGSEVQVEADVWAMDGRIRRMPVNTARCKFELTSAAGRAILAARGYSRLPREASAQRSRP
jgi:hypothetical protein